MKVFRFKFDNKRFYGGGEAIVAAANQQEAWDIVKKELAGDADFFNSQFAEVLHPLTYTLSEPALICYSCYVDTDVNELYPTTTI